jgi:hypothetical protein
MCIDRPQLASVRAEDTDSLRINSTSLAKRRAAAISEVGLPLTSLRTI